MLKLAAILYVATLVMACIHRSAQTPKTTTTKSYYVGTCKLGRADFCDHLG
jgi:hypothetical protein